MTSTNSRRSGTAEGGLVDGRQSTVRQPLFGVVSNHQDNDPTQAVPSFDKASVGVPTDFGDLLPVGLFVGGDHAD